MPLLLLNKEIIVGITCIGFVLCTHNEVTTTAKVKTCFSICSFERLFSELKGYKKLINDAVGVLL